MNQYGWLNRFGTIRGWMDAAALAALGVTGRSDISRTRHKQQLFVPSVTGRTASVFERVAMYSGVV
jgi:uncharacterized protein YraI